MKKGRIWKDNSIYYLDIVIHLVDESLCTQILLELLLSMNFTWIGERLGKQLGPIWIFVWAYLLT